MDKPPLTYSIVELNTAIKMVLNHAFAGYVWVRGEIQDYETKKYKKHIFFNLVEKDPVENMIVSQATAVIFENVKPLLNSRIKESGGVFELKEDIEVKFLCKVDFYPKAGAVRLIVADVDASYTAGKMAVARQRILNSLKEKGLLEKNKSIELSLLPLSIGLITSDGSAAYHDFMNEIENSHLPFKVMVYNCRMQGKEVEEDVVRALDYFNQQEGLDAVVVSRGGGSTSDLSWFDNAAIAEKIASLGLPVISALGHEINTTITDMVAHTSVKTPTKSAQFLIERAGEFIASLDEACEKITKNINERFERNREKLKSHTLRLDSLTGSCFKNHRESLAQKKQAIINIPAVLVREREKIRQCVKFISPRFDRIIARKGEGLKFAAEKIKILDPENILRRGYAVVYKDEKVVKSVSGISNGDKITTRLRDGKVVSKVENNTRQTA